MELENAVICIFAEGAARLGTVAAAAPPSAGPSISSILIGSRYPMASRALAERLAAKYGKLALASIHSGAPEGEAFKAFAELLNRL
ncbi:MAG: hypothetical protein QXW19_02375 [Candidatus Bathyarchaeia archaeon]